MVLLCVGIVGGGDVGVSGGNGFVDDGWWLEVAGWKVMGWRAGSGGMEGRGWKWARGFGVFGFVAGW